MACRLSDYLLKRYDATRFGASYQSQLDVAIMTLVETRRHLCVVMS